MCSSDLLLAGTNMTVTVDYQSGETIFSHVGLLPGQPSDSRSKGENVENKSEVKAESVKKISGRFNLLSLGEEWPAPLTRWFGTTATPAKIQPRYFHSYDQ